MSFKELRLKNSVAKIFFLYLSTTLIYILTCYSNTNFLFLYFTLILLIFVISPLCFFYIFGLLSFVIFVNQKILHFMHNPPHTHTYIHALAIALELLSYAPLLRTVFPHPSSLLPSLPPFVHSVLFVYYFSGN